MLRCTPCRAIMLTRSFGVVFEQFRIDSFRYLQDILEEHGSKPQGARPGSGGNGIAHGNGVGIKGKIPVSGMGVDIMQMLSKAQQEYDTVSFIVKFLNFGMQ